MINHVVFDEVIDFVKDKRLHEIYSDEKKQILNLFEEISTVYKNSMNRRWDGRCDICGNGDTNEIHRISNLVGGYEHRIKVSPILCWGHSCGWNRVFNDRQFESIFEKCSQEDRWKIARIAHKDYLLETYGLPDEEIDLLFATYLTKQLVVMSRKLKKLEL